MSSSRKPVRAAAIATAAALLLAPSAALAAEGFRHWWLPDDHSLHGSQIDSLFNWTFWITAVAFVLVQVTLVVFLIKYRTRPERKKAIFTHGNTRLEMAWTLAPAVILAGLAVANKGVWDRLRFNPDALRPDVTNVLVIGQQFKWNIIYPGPDGKLGRYLMFPKPTDTKWPDGSSFANVAGPAQLPSQQAMKAINTYIDQVNPLGKDFSDPDGKDDAWQGALAREMVIPVDRPVQVHLGSKDVIHSYFLPNHRVKLDAVPGIRGMIAFTATKTSLAKAEETIRKYTLEQLDAALQRPETKELSVRIDENAPGPVEAKNKDRTGWRYIDPADKKRVKSSIIRDTGGFPADEELRKGILDKLRAAGVTEVQAYIPGYWDIVCEELCGQGHYTMQGRLVVLDGAEYDKLKLDRIPPNLAPTTAPATQATQTASTR
ncbi:MAG TPA: cytochrome c oxidase subunit II transmembrane domain-containing protein [Tepidisphaeraceae bacterium]|nr:cytochrome c oxidase subunit II transmembrane domain-containing protein [Tepidisphaeraceae bacterium]